MDLAQIDAENLGVEVDELEAEDSTENYPSLDTLNYIMSEVKEKKLERFM